LKESPMNQAELHSLEARCTQEAAPHCRAACPLNMDIRPFLAHMAAGKWAEARKVLERHLPLPALLCALCDHPCEAACLRRDLGGALAMSALEQHCLASAPRQSKIIPRSLKPKALAVLGAGMAGLVAAYDCARKGLAVHIFYADESATGAENACLAAASALWRSFPQLAQSAWEEEWAQFAAVQVEFLPAGYCPVCPRASGIQRRLCGCGRCAAGAFGYAARTAGCGCHHAVC
jgi:hypothetical protein